MKPGTTSSGRICESPKISLPLPHHCGTPGFFPCCPVKGFGSSAGVPGSFFSVFVRMLSEITRHLLGIYSEITWEEVVGLQGIVYTFRFFAISI